MKPTPEKDINEIAKSLGEPSVLILNALDPIRPRPGIDILKRVEAVLEEAQDPNPRLDPSTLHYALKRMQDYGLVECLGERVVDVPGPGGMARRAERPVYVITGRGVQVFQAAVRRLERLSVAAGWISNPKANPGMA